MLKNLLLWCGVAVALASVFVGISVTNICFLPFALVACGGGYLLLFVKANRKHFEEE